MPRVSDRRPGRLLAYRLRGGHRDARIEKILGGNFARVFGDTWRG